MGNLFNTTPANQVSINAVNNTINGTLTNISSTVNVVGNYSNLIEIGGSGNVTNSQQIIDATSNINSLVNSTLITNDSTNIDTQVTQDLNNQSVSLLSSIGHVLSNNGIDVSTAVSNYVSNLHLTSIIPVCASDQKFSNAIITKAGSSGSAINDTQTITSDYYQSCITNTNESLNTISDITNTFAQKATVTETNPLDFLNGLFSGISQYFVVFIIFIILVGMIYVFKQKGSTNG